MNSTLENIHNYINFLRKNYNLYVTVHGGYNIGKYAEFNLHTNPYCLYIKNKEDVWNKCIESQEPIPQKCMECGEFFGMCHAGVCEYVYPITNKPDGEFICVSGYRVESGEIHEKALYKINKLCNTYGLDKKITLEMYQNNLTADIPDKAFLDVLIKPLCDLIRLEAIESSSAQIDPSCARERVFYEVCNLIRKAHNYKLSLEYICRITHYSPSYISHLFKKFSGMTINQYINDLRISEAKSLLKSTDLSVQEISQMIGFADSNYFSNVFKTKLGVSPRKYRQMMQ